MFWFYLLVLVVFAVFAFFPKEIKAIKDRDPAAKSAIEIILLYPGLHAIVAHRINHKLYQMKVPFFPRAISQFVRFLTGIEIHPGAQINDSLFIDHGTGVVIGETTIIGKNVTLFQGVTLGGTGKECGKRHPTIGDNVVIGAGAKVLGNITVGENSYVGANAVVIKDVPHNATVVGIPARLTKQDGERLDSEMDHAHILDPVMHNINKIKARLNELEGNSSKDEPEKEN